MGLLSLIPRLSPDITTAVFLMGGEFRGNGIFRRRHFPQIRQIIADQKTLGRRVSRVYQGINHNPIDGVTEYVTWQANSFGCSIRHHGTWKECAKIAMAENRESMGTRFLINDYTYGVAYDITDEVMGSDRSQRF